jgi:hypothetical protein
MSAMNRVLRLPSALFLAAALLVPTVRAQDVGGDWYGLLAPDDLGIRIILHVTPAGEGYAATIDSPEQGAFGIPLDSFVLETDRVTFTLAMANLVFEGRLDAGAGQIEGTFTQGGAPMPLVLGRTPVEAAPGPRWATDRVEKTEVYITMRDGVRLFTSIYAPRDSSRAWPIIINRTPYNIEPAGEERFSGKIGSFRHFLEDGYILVLQDVRGRFMSEGTYENIRPLLREKDGPEDIDESTDTYDTIEWLVNNVDGNNGRVGVLGISYPGFYSTTAIPGAHPALKAVSPQAPVTNWFLGDDWHHNGAFFMLDAFSFYVSNGVPRPEPTRAFPPQFRWPSEDNYQFFLELGAVPDVVSTHLEGIEFWPELIAHPNYDDFWKERDPRSHLTDVEPAVWTVGGWFDAEDLFGPLEVYRAIERQDADADNRLIMGPWSHGQWASGNAGNMGNVHWGRNTSADFKQMELAFFNEYLKDGPDDGLAEVTVFDTGALTWDSFDTWPPGASSETTLWLQPDGALGFQAPTATGSFSEYVSDPANPVPYTEDVHLRRTTAYMSDDQRFADRRPDVVTWRTEPLAEAVTLTGPVEADLWVTTTGTDADFVVKIVDVFPDSLSGYPENDDGVPMQGYQMLVRGEIMRGRFRESFERPVPFTPGEETLVRFSIPDLHHTFKPGHRIMVQVQSSWFPLVDRNPQTFVPNIFEAKDDDFVKAVHRIHHDVGHPSAVRLRRMDRP